jgi:hypothetical protein
VTWWRVPGKPLVNAYGRVLEPHRTKTQTPNGPPKYIDEGYIPPV